MATTTASLFPTQVAPSWNYGAALAQTRQSNQTLMDLLPSGDYNFTTTPVTWQDVRPQQVSATSAADEALQYNQSRLGQFTKMAKDLTEADTAVKMAQLDKFVPQWRSQRDTAAAINDAYMRGEIPTDVANRLKRDAAFTAVMSSGYGGEDNTRSITARDLGLTSLDLQQRGQAGAQSWTQLMAGLMPQQTTAAGVMGTLGLTSSQTLETSLQNAQNQLNADTVNSQGRSSTALQSQELRLSGEQARASADLNRAQLGSQNTLAILENLQNLGINRYQTDMNTSDINYNNQLLPYGINLEFSGLNSGLRSGAMGFGL